MSYTKGPWKLMEDSDSSHRNIHPEFFNGKVNSDNRQLIATVAAWGNGCNDATADEAKANARLIASAPELLEALKAVRTILLQNRALGLCQGIEYMYIVNEAEQVIAKAEGR